jgi:predicted NAD/FAD-binding protein
MKIAVIGSGISGLAAAWLLSRKHDVHLFEREDRLGGHTHTVEIDFGERTLPLDTGFLVYNERTYPNLTRVFDGLEVATQSSDMSFSVSCGEPDVEYASHSLGGLFARRRGLASPRFLRLLVDIVRFGKLGRRVLRENPDTRATVTDFLAGGGFGDDFTALYLAPMVAAIWSSGTQDVAEFPRDALLRFLDNHGLLQISGQPQWRTVIGGSHRYIPPMVAHLADRVHRGRPVERIVRKAHEVELYLADGSRDRFDHVVVATHADQALAMLADPSDGERELLGAWRYSVNDTWLHGDTRLMPRRRAAWASWNYLLESARNPSQRVCVTYDLNRLQRLDLEQRFLVTLNPPEEPEPGAVLRRLTYHHPIFDRASVAAQSDLPRLNGVNRTHFCGAYFGNGFHEDGLVSAIAVAADLGAEF